MKVLVTSGGTKIKIDLVRSITNMSRGTFGSQICDSFWHKLNADAHAKHEIPDEAHQITFFMAKNSRMPTAEHTASEFFDDDTRLNRYIEYDTFDDYRTKLTDLLKNEKFDIIVLAAAVSDYGVENVFNGKYRSSSDEMTIKLVKLPKVITEVRKLAPDAMICGFKLLVNSTDDELREAIGKQFAENGIDMCVGNDLRDIKNDNHRLTLKTAYSDDYEVFEKNALKDERKTLADVVVDKCFEVLDLKTGRENLKKEEA